MNFSFPLRCDAYIVTCQKQTARQMADYLDARVPESLKTTNEDVNKPEVVDNKVQGIVDAAEGVSDRETIVDDVQDSTQEIEARVIDGAQILVTSQSSTRLLSVSYV